MNGGRGPEGTRRTFLAKFFKGDNLLEVATMAIGAAVIGTHLIREGTGNQEFFVDSRIDPATRPLDGLLGNSKFEDIIPVYKPAKLLASGEEPRSLGGLLKRVDYDPHAEVSVLKLIPKLNPQIDGISDIGLVRPVETVAARLNLGLRDPNLGAIEVVTQLQQVLDMPPIAIEYLKSQGLYTTRWNPIEAARLTLSLVYGPQRELYKDSFEEFSRFCAEVRAGALLYANLDLRKVKLDVPEDIVAHWKDITNFVAKSGWMHSIRTSFVRGIARRWDFKDGVMPQVTWEDLLRFKSSEK